MPTEEEIKAAGPLSPDDPRVQAALKRLSQGMQDIIVRRLQREHAARVRRRSAPQSARCVRCGGDYGSWGWFGINADADPKSPAVVDLCAECFESLPPAIKWRERDLTRQCRAPSTPMPSCVLSAGRLQISDRHSQSCPSELHS